MNKCGRIITDIVDGDCSKTAGGVTGDIWLFDYDDIDRVATTISEDGSLSSLALKANATGVKFKTIGKADEGQASLVAGTYVNGFAHQIQHRILSRTNEGKATLAGLSNTRLVMVAKNTSNDGDAKQKFEVYGFDTGIVMTQCNYSTTIPDGIVYDTIFATADGSMESTLPRALFITDDSETEAMLNSLLTATPSN